ncbi:MAG: helix-turn-helix transcriptional regulator [Oligoflexia bacterium]|nr:helix-turn-helix transcriptional regulator [Oligoflexia bacterium]
MKKFKDVLNEIDSSVVTIGQAIRALRKGVNFTLKDIENLCKVKETHLSAIENDRMELSLNNARKIAAALGVHPSTILFPNDEDIPMKEINVIEKKRQKLLKEKRKSTSKVA